CADSSRNPTVREGAKKSPEHRSKAYGFADIRQTFKLAPSLTVGFLQPSSSKSSTESNPASRVGCGPSSAFQTYSESFECWPCRYCPRPCTRHLNRPDCFESIRTSG